MIVSREEARWITQGKKTALRIPVKPGQDKPRWRQGRDYAIEVISDRPDSELYGFTSTVVATGKTRRRRGKHARTVCRIVIDTVRVQRLRDLDVTAARREGFKTTSEYRGWWENTAGRAWDPDQEVWVLEFHLLRENDDRVRLLHARSELGYTQDHRQALPDEPEAIDIAQLRPEWTAGAEARYQDARQLKGIERELRSIAIQVRQEGLESARAGVDVADHLDAIRAELEAIRAKRDSQKEAA